MFKNLVTYSASEPLAISSSQLSDCKFRPVGKGEYHSCGFVPPCSGSTELVHTVGQHHIICLQKEERILPVSVVRDETNKFIKKIESEEGRMIGRKERQAIRDEVIKTLLPRSFTRMTRTLGWYDQRNNRLMIDAGNFKAADQFTIWLRTAIGTLPICPPVTKNSPARTMTSWLENPQLLPHSFTLGENATFKDLGNDHGEVRAKNQDLLSDELTACTVESGMLVSELALHFDEACLFKFRDDLRITGIKYTDSLQEQTLSDSEDPSEKFDAQVVLICNTLAEMINKLLMVMEG